MQSCTHQNDTIARKRQGQRYLQGHRSSVYVLCYCLTRPGNECDEDDSISQRVLWRLILGASPWHARDDCTYHQSRASWISTWYIIITKPLFKFFSLLSLSIVVVCVVVSCIRVCMFFSHTAGEFIAKGTERLESLYSNFLVESACSTPHRHQTS
jgi:hypothetical protein